MPVYLSAKRLYEAGTLDGLVNDIWDKYAQYGYEFDSEDPTIEQAIDAAQVFKSDLEGYYDGIVLNDTEFGGVSYVVFEPEQIKSATDNVGTFDPENPDIRYSQRELPQAVSIREHTEKAGRNAAMCSKKPACLFFQRRMLRASWASSHSLMCTPPP